MNLPAVRLTDAALIEKADRVLAGWLVESCPSEASRVIYRNDLKHFGEYLNAAGKDILHLDRQDIQAYLEFLRTQDLAAATRAKKLTVIKGLIRNL